MAADGLFIYVEVVNYKKFKGRNDVDKPSWFRCSNSIFDDDDLHDFSAAEMCAWWYILAQSSRQTSAVVRLNLEKVDAQHRKFSRDELQSAITKLCTTPKPIIRVAKESDIKRNRRVTPKPRIGQDRRGQDITGERKGDPPPPDLKISGLIIKELCGDPDVELAVAQVPEVLQREWVGKYDPAWLKSSLARAIAHGLKKDQVKSPAAISNWCGRLTSWFENERRPRLKTKPPPESKKEWKNSKPHDPDARARALAKNPELAEKLKKIKGVQAKVGA